MDRSLSREMAYKKTFITMFSKAGMYLLNFTISSVEAVVEMGAGIVHTDISIAKFKDDLGLAPCHQTQYTINSCRQGATVCTPTRVALLRCCSGLAGLPTGRRHTRTAACRNATRGFRFAS